MWSWANLIQCKEFISIKKNDGLDLLMHFIPQQTVEQLVFTLEKL